MLNNLQNFKVTIDNGPIGHTIEDIEVKEEPEFSVVNSIAFVNHLMNSDKNWDKIFHVSEKQSSQVTSKHDRTEITKSKQTYFSNDLKDLKPQFEKTDES